MNRFCDGFAVFQKQWHGRREAIYDYDNHKRYTYEEVDRRAETLSYYLTHILGLKKGDCVAFCARNTMAYFDMFFATYKTGIIITTYNHMYKQNELVALIKNEKPKVLFIDEKLEFQIDFLKNSTEISHYIIVNGLHKEKGLLYYEDIFDRCLGTVDSYPEISDEDIQMYIHTGGTTGMPKAAMLSFRCILANILSEGISFSLNSRDTAYLFLPLFHTGGWNVIAVPILFYGGKLIIKRDMEPEAVLEIIEKERVTIGVAVPTVYRMMADSPKFETADFSSVRWLLVGAAPADEAVMKKYHERNICLTNAYGMTEVGPNNIAPPAQSMEMEAIKSKWNSVGKPMCFNDIKIVDDNRRPVAKGQCGELCFCGPMLFSGYLNNDKETKQTMPDGWVYTGDIARQDEDGFIYIIGRKKNMIIVGGENIYPSEIEEWLTRFPGVKEACVFGIPDKKWGEVPKAVISLEKETVDMERLEEYMRKNLSGVKRPVKIIVADKIPKNSIGKIDYRTVHELYDKA